MRILVIGAGGREHALAWKLAQEAEVFAWPGNPGIAQVATVLIASSAIDAARDCQADLVVVGPENPLIDGLADQLRGLGFDVFGPGAAGAMLEASKAFSKQLMADCGVPTARGRTFNDAELAFEFAAGLYEERRNVVVKASGAALGKGVVVCHSLEEAEEAIQSMMVTREFGEAGDSVVVEERLDGREFSLLTACSDQGFWSLPVAQDYKRALDGDRGPNTGGMGTYSPVKWVSDELIRETELTIVAPILDKLRTQNISYRGVLFSGVMVFEDKPYCLEYNVRFGDPETQTVMRRLGAGFAALLLDTAKGRPLTPPEVLDNAAVSVVLASGGYPGEYEKGKSITIGEMPAGVEVFHAGTQLKDGALISAGGRVLAASALGQTVEEARSLAYEAVKEVSFEGMQLRTDVARDLP